jgi:hypothetical protein
MGRRVRGESDMQTRNGNLIIADLAGRTRHARHLGTTTGNVGPRRRLKMMTRLETEAQQNQYRHLPLLAQTAHTIDMRNRIKSNKAPTTCMFKGRLQILQQKPAIQDPL